MLKRILFLMLICLITLNCPVNAKPGLFIGGALGGNLVDGSGQYYSTYDYRRARLQFEGFQFSREATLEHHLEYFGKSDFTAKDQLGWSDKIIPSVSLNLGYNTAHKFTVVSGFEFLLSKNGLATDDYFYDNTYELDDLRYEQHDDEVEINNSFSQMKFNILAEFYFTNSFFITTGGEIYFLSLDMSIKQSGAASFSREEFSANAKGIIFGAGYSQNINFQTKFIVKATYSFANYTGNDLFFKELDWKIGGFKFETGIRVGLGR